VGQFQEKCKVGLNVGVNAGIVWTKGVVLLWEEMGLVLDKCQDGSKRCMYGESVGLGRGLGNQV
jgi:hypothetical protein